MEKVEIRPARLSDAEAIARLCSDDLGYACTASFVRRKLAAALENPCARVFVAEAGGAVAGYIHAADYDVLYFDTMKNVLGLAVSADYRRQGIGTALLGAVEAWARETKNARAARFCTVRAFVFSVCGKRLSAPRNTAPARSTARSTCRPRSAGAIRACRAG